MCRNRLVHSVLKVVLYDLVRGSLKVNDGNSERLKGSPSVSAKAAADWQ